VKGRNAPPFAKRPAQQGVVLVIALIMLALLSILATMSIRGASSTEQVSNQSRLKELAQQAAEAALRFCEQQVQANAANPNTGFPPAIAPVGIPYIWETMSNWDGPNISSSLRPVPIAAAGDAGSAVYFFRAPECMSQYMSPADDNVFVTTARGFGPDVKTNANPPKGTELWLQSVVTIQ
jgi:type IV pilus assembly protein PilX